MAAELRPICYSEKLFDPLIAEAAAGDGGFLLRLRDEWLSGEIRYDRPGELLLGAFAGQRLVGTGGICRDPFEPSDGLARLRHVYVLKAHRGRGIGRQLVRNLVAHAANHFRVLRLKTDNEVAARMYERLGFMPSSEGRETHRLLFQTSCVSRP